MSDGDDNVIDLAAAKERAAAAPPAPPPPPPESASARDDGDGGGEPKRKKEKTIDWGVYNHLLENFALIYGTDTVWDQQNRLIMKIGNMAHAYGADYVRMWKANKERWTVMPADVVFDPTETCGEECVNLFGGIQTEPKEGDVQPFLELARFLTSRAGDDADESDAIMHWLLCWFAYPLQHKGAKLRNAVVMHGDEGAGKNFLFETVVLIYGEYAALVGQDELEDKFNDWRSKKLFVVGDEVSSRQELVHNKNRLKALITSPTVQINPKGLPRREEANHINIGFLSNELQPLALDNTDRRYLVVYTPPAREREFYARLGAWRKAGGVQALYHYLLEYPLDDWDPYAPAPMTRAKQSLIDLNRKSPERFWAEWAGGELDLPYRSCTLEQAYRAYLAYARRTGDRFPLQRALFTRMVLRFSETMGRPASEKVMHPDTTGLTPDGRAKATRMFLVCAPPDTAKGQWATEAAQDFEPLLRKYLYGDHPPSPDGDEKGPEAGR